MPEPTQIPQDADRWRKELKEAGWTEDEKTSVWRAPWGAFYRGPYGAWKAMKTWQMQPTGGRR